MKSCNDVNSRISCYRDGCVFVLEESKEATFDHFGRREIEKKKWMDITMDGSGRATFSKVERASQPN